MRRSTLETRYREAVKDMQLAETDKGVQAAQRRAVAAEDALREHHMYHDGIFEALSDLADHEVAYNPPMSGEARVVDGVKIPATKRGCENAFRRAEYAVSHRGERGSVHAMHRVGVLQDELEERYKMDSEQVDLLVYLANAMDYRSF